MNIQIPDFALVVLIGTSGAGKSTFAATHFRPTETISSDFCRGLVSDDENSQAATGDAFDVLHYITAKRLQNRRLTAIDATNVRPEDRKQFIKIARQYHALPVAVVLNVRPGTAIERNIDRPDRTFGAHVVKRQYGALKRGLKGLKREGFRRVFVLREDEIADLTIQRVPLWNDKRTETGPFDLIGDIHGCADELEELLTKLGYEQAANGWQHPAGRKVVFLGDLVDRGNRVLDTLAIVQAMVANGNALCVAGNHDAKLLRWLRGRNVKLTHGLAETVAEIEQLPPEEQNDRKTQLREFLDSLISHYVLDDGKLIVAHAGLPESMHGRASGKVRQFALYGETTGEIDEFGLPVRYPWAQDYRGRAMVVYGHTPVPYAEWLNNTINIDTGCVFGGKLTALRYPEQELVAVPARRVYAESRRPLNANPLVESRSAQQEHDDLLDIDDVLGKLLIETRLRRRVTVRAENGAAALEVISRFAIDPKWLIYLPPTMSPTETSEREDLLEYPTEAFDYFRKMRVETVVCEEKHMGSRAIVVVCKDAAAARERFGVATGDGVIFTRTGRPFFNDAALESQLLARVRAALSACDFWERHQTEWVCLDCELMPWSVKAQSLINEQYAAVGAAANGALTAANAALAQATANGAAVGEIQSRFQQQAQQVNGYRAAYRAYCNPVGSVDDLRLAPFHILAAEGAAHVDKTHRWHMDEIAKITTPADPVLFQTKLRVVNLGDEAQVREATEWWEQMTATGGEGMVVKPLDFVVRSEKGLVQPAVKVRGKEYLRIIYGAGYDSAENLPRLRQRSVRRKRSLALAEFALGVEALERFVKREPLRRVHECVFAVLALESQPVDPRL